jgi:ribosomal protein S27E
VGYIVVAVIVWVLCAAVAAAAAPRGRQAEFCCLTLLILGPLGVGFAAVAVPREPEMPGRKRVVCPRCAAAEYVATGVDEFTCWRCDQRAAIDDWGRPRIPSDVATSKPKVQAASKPKVTPKPAPAGKATTVRCFKCRHTQQVPASASHFQCEKCDAKLTRAKT